MTSSINSSNTYQTPAEHRDTEARYAVNFARQRAQLRQEVSDSLPALKIGQIVYCWRDDLDSDGESIEGQGQWEAARVIRISRSQHTGQWLARVERFADGPGRWASFGPVEAFRTECPGVDDDDESDLQAAIAKIRALVADRAESDILARKVWNICKAVS